jgi:tRNA 2-thiocytidine biosynthesis protein TtcA
MVSKRTLTLLHRTITTYRLIEENDKVIVGVSGGADSLCLLSLLLEYARKRKRNWDLLALHIAPDFPNWNAARIERIFQRLGVNYLISPIAVSEQLAHGRDNLCYVCARERRKRMFDIARGRGIRKIALAHHLEDVNETYFLNLIYTSSAATFVPKQLLFNRDIEIIRPLYRFDKDTIRRHTAQAGLRPVNNRCPGAVTSNRMMLRRFLERLYRTNPRVRTNIFSGIHNVKPDYLP